MAVLHITEAELARDVHGVLEKIQNGAEVIVERDARPVAVMKPAEFRGRPIDECIALAKAYARKVGYEPVPDDDFAADVQAAIDSHREPLEPPEWD